MIEVYPIEISNKENALKIFSQQYKDSRDCIRELISNSIDERATFIRVRYIKNNIEIIDNGYGLNKDDFQRAMSHVADSIKKDQSDMIGTKGIGLFGTLTLGSHITWESHKKGFESLGIKISGDKIDEYGIIPTTLSEGITKVTIYNLTTSIKGIKPQQLCNYLSKKFGHLLQERGIVIHVEDKKGEIYPVKPELYKGEKWKISPLITVPTIKGGFISFDIYLLPFSDKEKKIAIRCKGVEVLSDITEITRLNHEPWSSDIVYGEIRADFLNTTSSRDGFIEDANLDIFINMLQSYEFDLQKLVNHKKELIKKKRDKNLTKIVDELLKRAIEKMNPYLYPEKSIPREKREGYSNRGIPVISKIPKPEKIRIQKHDKEKSQNLKRGYPDWILTHFPLEEINLRTKLIMENDKKKIWVNISHPDYLRSIDNRYDKTYIADMVMHEIILDSYKDKEYREYMETMQKWAIEKIDILS